MENLEPSHFTAFCALVQLAVALNFGFVYLEKKSMLFSLKEKLFKTYRAGNNTIVDYAANQLKRYRSSTLYDDRIEMLHTRLKEYHSIVTSPWDAEDELRYMPSMGCVYGLFSIVFLFVVCMFDVDFQFYTDLYLAYSLIASAMFTFTLIWSDILGRRMLLLPTITLYVMVMCVCTACQVAGWTISCSVDFKTCFHISLLLPFLPIAKYFITAMYQFLRKTGYLILMFLDAAEFSMLMDNRR